MIIRSAEPSRGRAGFSGARRAMTAGLAVLLCLWPGPAPASGQDRVRPEDLAAQYQEWLKVTSYIIRDNERDVFLHLTSDRDRDAFIEAFWKMRDPTPGTPQNEFREEHMKRFREADRRFRFGSARAGWMTDQGRIYIILGPPVNKTYFAGSSELYPAEIWAYYGDTEKGMPTHFELLFYQWRNAGEMKLYDPVADGPARLLVDRNEFMPTDYENMFIKIRDLQPDLSRAILSIIPGEIPPGFQPSLESTIFMAAIMESPRKNLDDRYATHFLNYKGVVSTEYLTNYMSSEGDVAILHDPATGQAFCDFAMSPARLSVDFYEPRGEYSTNFQVDVNLRAGDQVVFQYGKEYPLTVPADRLAEIEGMGVCIADSFPVVPGAFKLTVLLRNTVGKEFSLLERDIVVPPADGPPRLSAPVFGAKMSAAPAGSHVPFQAGERKLDIEPRRTFAAADPIAFVFGVSNLSRELWRDGSVGVEILGAAGTEPFRKSFAIPLSGRPFGPAAVVVQPLDAPDIKPDYYEIHLSLRDGGGAVLDERTGQFIITASKAMAHPMVAAKAFAGGNDFLIQYMLAYQYDRIGRTDLAEATYRRAFALNPSYKTKIPEYAEFLLRTGRAAEALGLAETLREETALAFQYHLLRGRALAGLERWEEAILSLTEGNRIYNSDAGLLAALGRCLHETGRDERALIALKASLGLNPEQADVKALIAAIEAAK